MNNSNGWGQAPNAWGQPAPAAPQVPQGAPQTPVGFPQHPQAAPQGAPPGYPPQMPPGAGYPQMPPGAGYAQPPQQPNFGMNPFAGLTSGDQTANRHPYLEDGDYVLKIESIKAKAARSGKLLYIIEAEILATNNPSRPVGMVTSSFIDMSNRDLAGRHLAAFTTAIHGFDPKQLPKETPVAPWADPVTGHQMQWGEYAVHSSSDANPWAGRVVGCTVTTIETKAGNDFGLHEWKPADRMVIGPMRQAAPVATAPVGLPSGGWGVAPGAAPQAAPQQQQAPAAAPAPAQNWGTPPAQGWGQPGR